MIKPKESQIHFACEEVGIKDWKLFKSIIEKEIPLCIQLFLCLLFQKSEQVNAIKLLLKMNAMSFMLEIIQNVCVTTSIFYERSYDLTTCFLSFLQQFQLKISTSMVLLERSGFHCVLEMELTALQESYPQCNGTLLRFYTTHRTIGHYYTIAQYVQDCKVCYETARTALDQLVDLHWYRKRKIGKKFVYSIDT